MLSLLRAKEDLWLESDGVCGCMQTHISTGESGEQFELIWWIAFGGHKVEKNLELTTAQETPLQELSAGRPDT